MKISDIESFAHRAVSVDLHFPESAIVSQQHNKELISREVFPKQSKGYRLSRHQLTRVKGFDVSNLIFLTDDGRGRQTTEQPRWRSAKWEIKTNILSQESLSLRLRGEDQWRSPSGQPSSEQLPGELQEWSDSQVESYLGLQLNHSDPVMHSAWLLFIW